MLLEQKCAINFRFYLVMRFMMKDRDCLDICGRLTFRFPSLRGVREKVVYQGMGMGDFPYHFAYMSYGDL